MRKKYRYAPPTKPLRSIFAVSFLYSQEQPAHFFSDRVPQRTFTVSPVSLLRIASGFRQECSPASSTCMEAPRKLHFRAALTSDSPWFSSSTISLHEEGEIPEKCQCFVNALHKNNALYERKNPFIAGKQGLFKSLFSLHGGCRGFESLIAHLLFPQKISRSDSSDIQLSRVHVSKVMTFVNIDNFMETSSSTASASKKAWNHVIPSLYMSARPWPCVSRRVKRIRSAAFAECAQTDAVPVTADGQRRGCIHAGGLRGGLHGA